MMRTYLLALLHVHPAPIQTGALLRSWGWHHTALARPRLPTLPTLPRLAPPAEAYSFSWRPLMYSLEAVEQYQEG